MSRCEHCGKPLQQTFRGRPRRYCGDACRKAAHRARRAAWEWIEANDPERAKLPTVEEMYAVEHGAAAAAPPSPDRSTPDDVVQSVIAAKAVAVELRRHGVAAAPTIAHRCAAVARALDAALAEHFGNVLKA